MGSEAEVEIIRLLGTALWVGFAAVVFRELRGPLVERVLPRLSGVRVAGVELEFLENGLRVAAAERDVVLPAGSSGRVARRAQRSEEITRGARVLWVDDLPDSTASERAVLGSLGVVIDIALDTTQALARLDTTTFDLIISDIERGGDSAAGISLAGLLARRDIAPRLVFYVAEFDPERGVPEGVVGGTTRPDELLHLVLDGLSRARG